MKNFLGFGFALFLSVAAAATAKPIPVPGQYHGVGTKGHSISFTLKKYRYKHRIDQFIISRFVVDGRMVIP